MPRLYEMTWDGAQARWVRQYKGKRYSIRASVLGVPGTKEASRSAANKWWREKRLEIDAANKLAEREPRPLDDLLAALLGSKRPWTDQGSIAASVAAYLQSLPPSKFAETLAESANDVAVAEAEQGDANAWEQLLAVLGERLLPQLLTRILLRGEPLPEDVAARLNPARVNQLESSIKGLRGEQAVPQERTVKSHADLWLSMQEKQVTIGEMTPARYSVLSLQARHFVDFAGPNADVSSVGADTIQGFYGHSLSQIAKGVWSRAYAREMFATVRRLVRWISEQGVIPLPPNIASRSFRFGATAQTIEVWTPEEVRHVFGEASDRLRLYLLLMLNAGLTQKDISDLQSSEIDWTAGRLTRKRSKTGDKASVPTVSYPLWSETFTLLQKFRSGQANVLLTETGKPLVRQELCDGKLKSADIIAGNFEQLKKRLKFTKNLKALRKTAASKLAEHPIYGRFTSLFLGHAPSTMADRHYVSVPQQLLDESVCWLGAQFNLAGG